MKTENGLEIFRSMCNDAKIYGKFHFLNSITGKDGFFSYDIRIFFLFVFFEMHLHVRTHARWLVTNRLAKGELLIY